VGIYIDDFIGVAPEIDDVPSKVIRAIPLAIRTVSRPLSNDDIIPRKDIISLKKLSAEGQLSEIKTILGWCIDTRALTISMPTHKALDWLREIDIIIEAGRVNYKVLESMLGRLNHVAGIFPPMRHFMGHLYSALYRARARKGGTVLSASKLEDLGLHADFIRLAQSGVSLNNVTYRKPTHIHRSDAYDFGLWGYNLVFGKAWRWEIPVDLRLRTSIDSLEFLACVITIWLDLLGSNIAPEDCLLSQTDNSSAAG
jgi:hypothetical protein